MQTSSIGRREFLASGAALVSAPVFAQRSLQRVVVVMCDGFGLEYLEQSDMPVLTKWRRYGLFQRVQATMPRVTNTNNASLCCDVGLDLHGLLWTPSLQISPGMVRGN